MPNHAFPGRQIFAALAGALLLTACKPGDEGDPVPPAAATSYKDAAFTAIFKRTSGAVAFDGAASIPLSNGNSLWTLADSYIDNFDAATGTVPCLFQVRNAGLLLGIATPQTGAQTLLGTGTPKSFFAVGTDNAYWFWPGGGYQRGDTAYVFMQRLRATGGGGAFAFEVVDSLYVGKVAVPGMTVAGYARLGPKSGIDFSHGVVAGDGYMHVYGTRDNGFGKDFFVARYPEGNLYAPWEYYGTSGWTPDISAAAKLHSEFTSSFHVSKVAGKYVLLTTQFSVGCDQGKEIYSYTSSTPQGPFGNKKTVWTVDDTPEGHLPFFYLANAHPEYDNGRGELLITYCINGYGTCVETCSGGRMNPDVYRPRAVRVPYALMGL